MSPHRPSLKHRHVPATPLQCPSPPAAASSSRVPNAQAPPRRAASAAAAAPAPAPAAELPARYRGPGAPLRAPRHGAVGPPRAVPGVPREGPSRGAVGCGGRGGVCGGGRRRRRRRGGRGGPAVARPHRVRDRGLRAPLAAPPGVRPDVVGPGRHARARVARRRGARGAGAERVRGGVPPPADPGVGGHVAVPVHEPHGPPLGPPDRAHRRRGRAARGRRRRGRAVGGARGRRHRGVRGQPGGRAREVRLEGDGVRRRAVGEPLGEHLLQPQHGVRGRRRRAQPPPRHGARADARRLHREVPQAVRK